MTPEQFNALLGYTPEESGITAFTEDQQSVISRIRQGGDAIFSGGNSADLTTAAALVSIMKAPQAFEGSPRVLLLSPTVESVHTLHEQLTRWVRRTEIAVELAHDKGNMVQERNNIFEGADIITGNARRIHDLYNQNGIHVGQLTLFIIDRADEIAKDPVNAQRVHRLAESLPKKCQRIILSRAINPRVEKMAEVICSYPKIFTLTPAENA